MNPPSDMKEAGVRSGNGKIKCYFSKRTGVSTLRQHITSHGGKHWEAYQTHFQQIRILMNEQATPNNVKEMREALLKELVISIYYVLPLSYVFIL
jgi:hypothetical protein